MNDDVRTEPFVVDVSVDFAIEHTNVRDKNLQICNISVGNKEISKNTGEVSISTRSAVDTGKEFGAVYRRRVYRHRIARWNFRTVNNKPSLVIVAMYDENPSVWNVVPNGRSCRVCLIKVGRQRILKSVSNETDLNNFVAFTVAILAEIHNTSPDTIVASRKEGVCDGPKSANVRASATELHNGCLRSIECGRIVVRTERRKRGHRRRA